MTVGHETKQKRYLEGSVELLRTEFTVPLLSGDGDFDVFHGLYRELSEASGCFAETQLLPLLKKTYEALPEHDRKFRPPKQIYTVEMRAEDMGETVTVRLTAKLRNRTGTVFEVLDVQTWAMRRGCLLLVPPKKSKRRKRKKADSR